MYYVLWLVAVVVEDESQMYYVNWAMGIEQ